MRTRTAAALGVLAGLALLVSTVEAGAADDELRYESFAYCLDYTKPDRACPANTFWGVTLVMRRTGCNRSPCREKHFPYRLCIRPPHPQEPSQKKICRRHHATSNSNRDLDSVDVNYREIPPALDGQRGVWRFTWKRQGRVISRTKLRTRYYPCSNDPDSRCG